jgi:hypothetical protein
MEILGLCSQPVLFYWMNPLVLATHLPKGTKQLPPVVVVLAA